MNFWHQLKQKWAITSNVQMAVILVVFALTGSSITFVRRPIFDLLGISSATSLWISVPSYLLIIFPLYSVLLLFFGTILGQFRFFWNFEKKMWGRFAKPLNKMRTMFTPLDRQENR